MRRTRLIAQWITSAFLLVAPAVASTPRAPAASAPVVAADAPAHARVEPDSAKVARRPPAEPEVAAEREGAARVRVPLRAETPRVGLGTAVKEPPSHPTVVVPREGARLEGARPEPKDASEKKAIRPVSQNPALDALYRRFADRVDHTTIRPDEAALAKSFIVAALAHPNADPRELMRYTDASSQFETVRWVVAQMKVELAKNEHTAAHEKVKEDIWDSDLILDTPGTARGFARFFREKVQAAEAILARSPKDLRDGPLMSYEEYARIMAQYTYASGNTGYYAQGWAEADKESHELRASAEERTYERLSGIEPSYFSLTDKFGSRQPSYQVSPYRFLLYTSRALDLDEMDDAAAAGIHYVGLLKSGESAVADGIGRDVGAFAQHDIDHFQLPNLHESSQHWGFLNGTGETHSADYLTKAVASLDLRDKFKAYRDTFSDATDRRILEWFWFNSGHEVERPVSAAEFHAFLSAGIRNKFSYDMGRIENPRDIGPVFKNAKEVTAQRLMDLAKKLSVFLKGQTDDKG